MEHLLPEKSMKKTPTLKEKVKMYEDFLHKINMFVICCDNDGVAELVRNADNWSYTHRCGNGELSDRQQKQLINNAFWKLCDTPEADKKTKKRQELYMKRKQSESYIL
jgi:hypothetical protein